MAAIIVGIFIIYRLVSKTGLGKYWENFIERRLIKSRIFEEGNIEDLLHVADDYGVVQATVSTNSSLIGRTLVDINSDENPFWIVGIRGYKKCISLPRSIEVIQNGDKLVVYGDSNL